MHPITPYDKKMFFKYNLKNNTRKLLKSIIDKENSEFYLSWIGGKKIRMRKGKTDILVFRKIFIEKEYDFDLGDRVETIIDAGANIGLSSIFFANKFPKATIIAIEPEISNFKLLKENVAPYLNIQPVFGGINNESGSFKIKNPSGDHWNFMLERSVQNKEGDGRFFTIDEIAEKFSFSSIDFLKIDIEGGEENLFKDNYNWLKKVKALSIELHDFILPHSSNSFLKAISNFCPFSFMNYGENILIRF